MNNDEYLPTAGSRERETGSRFAYGSIYTLYVNV